MIQIRKHPPQKFDKIVQQQKQRPIPKFHSPYKLNSGYRIKNPQVIIPIT